MIISCLPMRTCHAIDPAQERVGVAPGRVLWVVAVVLQGVSWVAGWAQESIESTLTTGAHVLQLGLPRPSYHGQHLGAPAGDSLLHSCPLSPCINLPSCTLES